MVEDLHLDAVLRQLVGFYLLERLFRHPHEDTRVAAGTQMPHSTSSSKLVTVRCVRITPIGWPVQLRRSFFQVQVSGSQLTLVKSSCASGRQPGSVPSTNALGRPGGCCPKPGRKQSAGSRTSPVKPKTSIRKARGTPALLNRNALTK